LGVEILGVEILGTEILMSEILMLVVPAVPAAVAIRTIACAVAVG
jgi:hypothetical protein